jgi:hypothetical protein
MNAVEIEEAVSALSELPFDREAFPFAFLAAFGNKETTIKRLRAGKGSTNASDLPGGVLQRNNIHIAVADPGEVAQTLAVLRASPATAKARAKFVLATDGDTFEAEDMESGETVACIYADFPDHFGFFLSLAGISTVKQVRDSSFDIRATSRLNKLYVELLSANADWSAADRRPEMNHFMARLIFCFFAEDTDIFHPSYRFTAKVEQMSERDSSNTHEVIGAIFRAMNTPTKHNGQLDDRHRRAANIPRWADGFPYVNGGLFSGSLVVPRFSRIARAHLISIGNLDWTKINPDIFGSMIQAVADDEERGALGMHYTSVPNILKVLNPLFLDDLRGRLAEAGDNGRMLLNLRRRMARIRIFDPACGSGNFLVIAYKEMRAIEAEINARRGEVERVSDIPLTNFRGIELRDFPAEIARLALIIAEFQCDVLYRGQKLALAEFLPLNAENWITCGNALRLDWLSICPPTGTGVKLVGDDLFQTPLDQTQIDFENEGGETYICGNPPYRGSSWQTNDQKSDLEYVSEGKIKSWKSLDYVAGWFIKASSYLRFVTGHFSFVATKSICEGEQAPVLWPFIFNIGLEIEFAHTPFNWANLASNKAGVTVVVVGVGSGTSEKRIYDGLAYRTVGVIGPYLAPGSQAIVSKTMQPIGPQSKMLRGNMPTDGGNFLLTTEEAHAGPLQDMVSDGFIRPFMGASEVLSGRPRFCIWIESHKLDRAMAFPFVRQRVENVREMRLSSSAPTTRNTKIPPYRFMQIEGLSEKFSIAIPAITSENRDYLPIALLSGDVILSNKCYALYDAPLWNLALASSILHRIWIGTVCARMRSDYSYSNTLGWNTFPVPALTEKNKVDLARCAEDILLAREAHFPATIADLYEVKDGESKMPADLREAHERNDEVLERIYIGRRFRNDTERLEKLFELYTRMTATASVPKTARRAKA